MVQKTKNVQRNLRPSNFRLIIDRLPDTTWNVQRIETPSLSLGTSIQPTFLKNVSHSGDKIDYSNFDVTFIVDEDLKDYFEILGWMHGLGFPENTDQFEKLTQTKEKLYSDITVYLLTNNSNANLELKFLRCFPVNLSGLSLDTTLDANTLITATASFEFTNYNYRISTTSDIF